MKQANTTPHLPQACPEWAEKLNAIHRNDLPFEERAELRKHLETCANCRAVKAEYRALDALITGLPPVEPLPAMPPRLRELTGTRAEMLHTPQLTHSLEGPPLEHAWSAEPEKDPFTYELPGARAEFSRKRELAGVREEAAPYLVDDETRQRPIPARASARQQQRMPHPRRRTIRLNMAAAVLLVSALVAGFLILHVSHPSRLASAPGPSKTNHAQTPIQHSTYLDVIIGNAHGDSYAVDPQTGAIVWKHQVMSAPASYPFSANGILYYTGTNNVLYAIDGGNGQLLWHLQLAPNNQNTQMGWGMAADGNLIFVSGKNFTTGSNTLYALNAYSGAIAWQKHLQNSQNEFLIVAAVNGVLYSVNNGLSAWSAKDGHQLWYNPRLNLGESDNYAAPLIVAHGKLYFFQGPQYLKGNSGPVQGSNQIEVVNASTGGLLRTITIKTSDPQPVGLAVSGDTLYAAMDSGKGTPSVQAYSLSDEHLLWYKSLIGRINSLSASNEHVYLGIVDASKVAGFTTQALLALNGSDGSQLWRWSDTVAPAMMVAAVEINGVVCVIDGGVVGVRANDGHRLWQTTFSLATGFPPVVD